MPIKDYSILSLLLAFSMQAFTQQRLTGTVIKKGSAEVLIGVTVYNFTLKIYSTSDRVGKYAIPASLGDTILFSSAGYLPDTVVIALYMFSEDYLVPLLPRVMDLPSLNVDEMGKYQADSLKRREDYGFILDKRHPVKLMNEKRPGDEPGFSFSPLGFFSRKEKQERRLKKRLEQEEEDYYVDYRFSASRVGSLTALKGDSLRIFMMLYRPSYTFCRKANNQDLFLYINDKLILFKKRKS